MRVPLLDSQRFEILEIDLLNGFTGRVMFLLAFIEPPQADVIETIVRHRSLWQASGPKAHWVFAGWERVTAHKSPNTALNQPLLLVESLLSVEIKFPMLRAYRHDPKS